MTRDDTVDAVTLTHGPIPGASASFSETRETMTIQIDRETAENDFIRWCDRARIDTEFKESTEDGEARARARDRIIRAIEKGFFTVDDEGIGTLTADVKGAQTKITFSEFYTGAHVAMDRKKEGHNFAKLNASLSAMTKQSDVTFAQMHPTDAKICQAVALLFLV